MNNETVTLHDVQLCRVGSWKPSLAISPGDISSCVALFAKPIPVKVTHEPGAEVVGRCVKVYERDGSLFGDLVVTVMPACESMPTMSDSVAGLLGLETTTPRLRRVAIAFSGV